jgi:hypothetical protein
MLGALAVRVHVADELLLPCVTVHDVEVCVNASVAAPCSELARSAGTWPMSCYII